MDQKLNTLIESMLDLKPKPKLKILIKQLKTINILYNFMSSKKILSPRRKISIKTENPVENKDYFVNKNAEAKYLNIESELDKVLNLGKI